MFYSLLQNTIHSDSNYSIINCPSSSQMTRRTFVSVIDGSRNCTIMIPSEPHFLVFMPLFISYP